MREITYQDAITEAIDEEMKRDPTVFLLGEDIRAWGAPLGEFKGLFEKYGPERVYDTPVSETAIIGAAIGAGIMGSRPIANIMFSEFLGVCWSEITNALCKKRYETGGKVKMPVTIVSYSGAGITAAGEHSANQYGMLLAITGLKLVIPSTPYDVKGLLKSSIRDDNPVLFLYHKLLMVDKLKGEVPRKDYTIPLGKADIKREGSDVTVVATAAMVHRSLAAAEKLQEEGINIEVIDPRTLKPLDVETILNSVRKTGKLVIIDEDPEIGSAAGEIASIVAEEGFYDLDAPIKRVCAPDTPVPFAPNLEKLWIPDEDKLMKAVREIA
jgi:pyruvate dehydrogenase E1 component beta subunit